MNELNNKHYKTSADFLKDSYDPSDVSLGYRYWKKYLLSKCQDLFIYHGLPDTIPSWQIEKSLLIKGYAVIVKKNGKLYAPFEGKVSGNDYNYNANRFSYGNAVIGSQSHLKDGVDCAIIWNTDSDKMTRSSGIFETINRYARILADIESSMQIKLVTSRTGLMCQVQNATAGKAMREVIDNLKAGKIDTITNPTMTAKTLELLSITTDSNFTPYIEATDYYINKFYNEIGLQTLEEKKERMITSEVENPQDADIRTNNINIMYKCRIEGLVNVCNTFGVEWKISKSKLVKG